MTYVSSLLNFKRLIKMALFIFLVTAVSRLLHYKYKVALVH